MSECMEKVSSEDLKNYWRTFFEGKMTIKEIDDMLETVSNTNLDKIIEKNKSMSTSVIESLIWGKIKNEKLLQETLENLKDKSYWIYFFEPILKKYADNLIDTVKDCKLIYNVNLFLLNVIEYILNQLNQIAYQTLIIELYYSKQNNLLEGNSKEERGQYFLNVLLRDDVYRKEVFSNYPELTRLLDVKTQYSVDFIIKIINDTNKEINNIEACLNDNNTLGKIKKIYIGEGDTHNKGKSVARLVFDTNKILIYKPHKLDIDKKYYDFIQWINNLKIVGDSKEKLLASKVYTINDAGWAEFIEYIGCNDEEELENFYYRIGRVLCLVHTLNGNDMHNENIIAHKDMPVLIDLETLMHPDINSNISAESAIEIAMNEVLESVTSTHLLPSKIINPKSNKILEIGGLGAYEEQESPFKGKYIKDYGTDQVRIVKRYGKILPHNNNPIYNNQVVDAKIYKEEIINGFKEMYKWILENKKIYINKVKSIFEKCDIRILYRGTNVYAQLLVSSFHPDLLTNSADRYIFLHRIATEYKKRNNRIQNLEINALMQGDIPYFTINSSETEIDKLDIKYIKNNEIMSKKSTIEKVIDKIANMSEMKMYRQIAAINTSFITEDYTGHIKTTINFKKNGEGKYTKDTFIRIATEIADYILSRSITGEKSGVKSRTWLQEQDFDLGFKLYDNASADLYSGLSGIVLLYNYLWKVSKNIKYKKVMEETIVTILESFPKNYRVEDINKIKIGAFNGIGGVAYALCYLDYSNNTSIYEKDILNIFNMLDYNISKNNTEDIINRTGNLGIMISIYKKSRNKLIKNRALDLAKKIFKNLEKSKIKIDNYPGISWSQEGYVGYSHGNAGIIAQLYRLYDITKEMDVLNLVEEALLYERAMFSTENNNWYKSINDKTTICGWCHGAAGILLSKLQLKNLGYKDEVIYNEIITAIKIIKETGLNNDISLCHGDMGNLVILKEAAISLNDNELYNEAVATIEELLEYIMKLINTESFKGKEYNGFMVGLSGIAYEILRIGREHEMPNILGLE